MLKFGNKSVKKIFKIIGIITLFLCILPYFFPLSSLNIHQIIKDNPNKTWGIVDDIQLHYQYLPTKDTLKKGNIVMIHGFSGSTFSWRKNTEILQKNGYDVILIDLPSFGLSDRTQMKNHSATQRGILIWRFLEKYFPKNKKYTFFGHSMGSSVVLAMAEQKPNQTEQLFLVDGAYLRFGTRSWGTYFTLCFLAFPPVERGIAVIAEYFFYTPAYFQKILGSAYQTKPTLEDANGYLFPFKIEGTTQAILRSFRFAREENETIKKPKIKIPIFMIWGKKDTWVPIKNAEIFIKQNPSTQLFTFDDAGHNPMESHEKEFNTLIIKLLNDK
ncbi:MAG: alpha/beta hydrolase [Bacteroidetes bacterium]|nr:MAG: alpha/beta hydrolase [Bacteroidota bacterium]TAG95697.1 MAG: alpha/beta hydrolase [Bacteroidota bacterium]